MANWRKTVERNWLYMLAATLLSVLLWVGVSADTVSQRWIPADLVIINGDRRYIQTGQEPETETVDVLFTGREGAMLALSVARPQVYISLDSIESTTYEIDLDPRMVTGRGGRELGDVRAVGIRPDMVRLLFERRAQKVVPVVPNVILSFAEGYMLADSVRVKPGVVAIEGPASEIEPLDSVPTVPIRRQRLSESIDVEVLLAIPDSLSYVESSSNTVNVTVAVEQRAERVFPGVPLSVENGELGEYRVQPSLVDIRLVGPQGAVAAVRPESLTPVVRLPSDTASVVPIVLESPGPFIRVELMPDSAEISGVEGGR